MAGPGGGALRVVRGGLVAGVVLLVSGVAHVVGGGARPPLGVLLLAFGAATAFCVGASDRRWTRGRAVGVLLGGQAALHAVLSLTAPPMAGMAGMPGHAVGPRPVSGGDVRMVLAHVLAAAAVGALLAAGDHAVWLLYAVVDAVRSVAVRLRSRAVTATAPVRCRSSCRAGRGSWLRSCRCSSAAVCPGAGRRPSRPPATDTSPFRHLPGLTRTCGLPTVPPRGNHLMLSVPGRPRRPVLLFLTAAAAGGVLVLAAPASAHVTVSAPAAIPGGYANLVFQVPTESATAGTVRVQVTLPAGTPLAEVTPRTHPGWTVTTRKVKLATPVSTDDATVTSAVRTVTWTARPGQGVRPGQFDEFTVAVGPLPRVTAMVFPVRQTYSDGTVVNWAQPAQPGQAEPEHPAPRLPLGAAASPNPSTSRAPTVSAGPGPGPAAADVPARVLAGAGLLAGLGALTVTLTRRRRS